ncbi:efflux RND transporter periplasmic adaptor subunit [Paenibacillus hexagrammi]|uniref:Biotin/lipoyl-binding protein n=1 Tax=Paenibacillus hexagrammi TaxID=2908839 RepID=A0ABY3SDS6_9BACL|nr:biotin/lipoyl-binding protein [Paenibacillus sp. YPD9-1]UJF31374.1 biotin/lipoyl-binding protein [Paenibacillus sp. YPD9-1]
MYTKRNTAIIALIAIMLTVSGCGAAPAGTASETPVAAMPKVVKVSDVQKMKWEDSAELAADVIPFVELDVVAKVSGDVVDILKKRGDSVNKDDAILEVDQTDIAREKEKVDAALQAANEQYDKAKRDLADSKKEINLSIAKAELSISDLSGITQECATILMKVSVSKGI